MKATPVIIERTFQAPVAKVWKALTDERQIQSWYFDIPHFKAEPGFEFVFYGGDGEQQWAHYCTILEAIKEKKLSYTWKYDEFPEVETVVTWELFAEDKNTTKLRLTHVGLEGFPQNKKNFNKESFIGGWTHIVGISLKDYVEKEFIEYTLDLKASPARVWEIITNKDLIKQWAAAFHEGTYVETDFKQGSPVAWYDGNGNLGAKGIIVINEKEKALRMQYYDDPTKEPPAQPDTYAEAYRLFPQDGGTKLYITSGPLAEEYKEMHKAMWAKAVANIQEMASA